VLEPNRAALQEVGKLEERGVSCRTRELMVHPYLDLPIIDAIAASGTVVFPGSNPLQEYIVRACSTGYPLWTITKRDARFLRQI